MMKLVSDQVSYMITIGLLVVFGLGFIGILGHYGTIKDKALASTNNPQLMCFAKAKTTDQFKVCENVGKEIK